MMKPAKNAIDLGVFVSDIQASLNFYQNWLGLEKEGETPMPMGMMHRLKFGNSDFKLIDPKEAPPKGPSGMTAQLGFRYVTFSVENISEICASLKEKGVKFSIPETEFMPGVKIAMVKDPDGNTVEFVQRNA
jgi:catechol 2,3-dioxygenase-like lactoylglutathione lyase family enzyme